MLQPRSMSPCLPIAFILPLLLVGCGGPAAISVQGKVIPPTKIRMVDTDAVELRFLPENPEGQSGATSAAASEQYAFQTKLAPGKYRVIAKVAPYPGMTGNEKRIPLIDTFNDQYDDADTKMTIDVTSSTRMITVDLASGKASAE